ncbi:MAG: YciI family protein [Caldilinea sp. CFX5]|nr:YciI family protein [Caldilinea sp. CFX5]
MKYMFLIYTEESSESQMSATEREAMMAEYFAFTREAGDHGVLVAGDELKPTGTATTLRLRNNQFATTDGPFAETKEQLGGFYILECQDMDEAVGWAAKIPGAKHGSIEVRPIVNFG